jgi:hypothetical protein
VDPASEQLPYRTKLVNHATLTRHPGTLPLLLAKELQGGKAHFIIFS